MSELKSYQVTSRIRFSGNVYRPGGDPIVLTDADAARLAKLGCIDLVPVPELVAEPVPGGDTVSPDAPEANPALAATGGKEAAKASKGA